MPIDLEQLGLSQPALQELVVDQIVRQVVKGTTWDEDGNPIETDSRFNELLKKQVQTKIDSVVEALGAKFILPNFTTYIETLTLQETNKWGEKKKEPFTFIEYLIARAHEYAHELVDEKGRSSTEVSAYDRSSWRGIQPRLTHILNNHLSYSIQTAMKEAIKNANATLATAITDTVRLRLEEITKSISATITLPR